MQRIYDEQTAGAPDSRNKQWHNVTAHSTRPSTPTTSFDEKTVLGSPSSSNRGNKEHAAEHAEEEAEAEHAESRVAYQGGAEEDHPLEPAVSKQPSVNNVTSIPNGGVTAWLQVLGAFFLFFNSWYVLGNLVAP